MENITPEQYEKYIDILNWDSCEMDLRYLIFKYRVALCDYYHESVYDTDKLNLIVDSFLYFSSFEPSSNLDDFAYILINLREERNEVSDYTDAELIAMYIYLITFAIVNKNEDDILTQRKCEVLYKLASTVAPIQNYEEQYGDINTLIKELKERGAQ